jgi:tetratricopeptide (TPR) repeat protein
MDAQLINNDTTEELRVPPAPSSEDAQREEMLDYYWRKGIPSIVLAIVTLVLAGYSFWFVQPNIKQRYRDICSRNFLMLEGNASTENNAEKIESKQPWQVEAEENKAANSAAQLGSEERRRLLEQTQLCLRRLIIWDKSDDSVRYQSALVANLLADWHLDRAQSVPTDAKTQDNIGVLVSRSLAERKKAADAMRAVQKINGKFAGNAYLWTARQRLQETLDLPTDELDAIATRTAELLATQENHTDEFVSDANAMLAEIFVRRALAPSKQSANEATAELKPQVIEFFETTQNADVVELAWAAEAQSISNLAAGQTIATKALQSFWGKPENETASVETLNAVFRCLILVNSIKEGQVFLTERLQQIPAFEQSRFRTLTAAGCLRQIMLNAITGKQDTDVAQASQALLSTSLQLNPKSDQLLTMIEQVSKPSNSDTNSIRLKTLMGLSTEPVAARQTASIPDVGLRALLNACVGLHETPIGEATLVQLKTAIKATPIYGIVASRLAMRLVASDPARVEEALRWMSAINDASPEVLAAWSERAKLHLMKKEYAKAIECFEFLLGKLPGNEQLIEAIDAAKSQLAGEAK